MHHIGFYDTPENVQLIDALCEQRSQETGKKVSRGEICRAALAAYIDGYENTIPRRGEYDRETTPAENGENA